ncbi:MAG: thioredoxin family protein [Alphaproteobacteria bacterium]
MRAGVMLTALAFGLGLAAPALAAPEIGEPAPAFTAVDSDGKQHSLSDFKGKTVILEWTNHGCPYVQKHYDTGNMQALQKETTGEGAVWLTVISSAPGKQGYVTAEKANELTEKRDAAPTAVLFDPTGEIGKSYGATATPHMYIVDEEGVLRYMGAIDDKPTARRKSVETATNYVKAALAEMEAGKPVSTPVTRAYGCSIKYAK